MGRRLSRYGSCKYQMCKRHCGLQFPFHLNTCFFWKQACIGSRYPVHLVLTYTGHHVQEQTHCNHFVL